MAERARKLVVAVRLRADGNPRRASEVLRWIRWMLPAAVLLVGPAPAAATATEDPAGADADEVITIDADAVRSGPLSVAAALAREHGRVPRAPLPGDR